MGEAVRRVPLLSEQTRLVVLAIIVGLLTGWGAVGFLLLLDRMTDFARGPVAGALSAVGVPGLVVGSARPSGPRPVTSMRPQVGTSLASTERRTWGRRAPGTPSLVLELCRSFETSSCAGRQLRRLIA